MALIVNIKFEGKNIEKHLNNVSTGIRDLSDPFKKAGDELLDFYGNKVFESQGAELGETWKSLSPVTLKLRAQRRLHYANPPIATDKILIWTGKLKKGFSQTVEKMKLTIQNTVDYFKYNQPKRKILDINKKVIQIVIDKINDYLLAITSK